MDAQENPVGVLIPVQIHQYHKYVTLWNYLADPLVIYWNKEQWDAFPADIKKPIQDAANEAAKFEKAIARAGLDGEKSIQILKEEFHYTMEVPEPMKFFQEKGMTVIDTFRGATEGVQDAEKPVHEKWAVQVGRDIYDKAVADMAR